MREREMTSPAALSNGDEGPIYQTDQKASLTKDLWNRSNKFASLFSARYAFRNRDETIITDR